MLTFHNVGEMSGIGFLNGFFVLVIRGEGMTDFVITTALILLIREEILRLL